MPRPSFSFTLIVSFLLIAGVLGAAAFSGWLAIEGFARDSRAAADTALELSGAVQQLAERTVDIERNARQFLVLKDESIHERFRSAHREADEALLRLETQLPTLAELGAQWRERAEAASATIAAVAATTADGNAKEADPAASDHTEAMVASLTGLADINRKLARGAEEAITVHNRELLDRLDRTRDAFTARIVGAVIAAALLAILAGWWLLRPLRRIELAISELGESRFEQPITVGGPADLVQVGRQLDWLRLRLTDLESNRNRILRHVSHELKTPLASLREGVSLLADGVLGRLSSEQCEVVDILDHNARALQERIEQLLHYNAIQFDARRMHLRPTALLPVVRDVVGELQLQAQARGIRVSIEGDAPIVSADAGKLRIALSNLLTNAIGFSPAGGKVQIVLSTIDDKVLIDCIDSGTGVAPNEIDHIFDPFFQGSGPDDRVPKGSGLGLTIVREFVAAHGGRASVVPDSEGGHFRIELPHVR